MSTHSESATPLSSAGWCYGCAVWAERRYGGEGRYFAYCSLCWSGDLPDSDKHAANSGEDSYPNGERGD